MNTNDKPSDSKAAAPTRTDAGDAARTDGASVKLTKKRRRKRRRGDGNTNITNSPVAGGHFAAVKDAIETLRRSTLALARARGQEQSLDGIELKLKIRRDSPPELLATEFFNELNARLDEARTEEDFVVPRRAFCFRCESFLCEHSAPPEPRSVLSNYEPAGRPVWIEFASLLYNRNDPRAEAVARRKPGLLTLIMESREVNADRIEAFGGPRPPVEVLCQLAVGMFTISERNGSEEAALTLQWLLVRGGPRPRLVFHPIGDPRLLDYTFTDPDLAKILTSERNAARTHPAHIHKKRPAPAQDRSIQFAVARAHALARDLQHHYSVRGRRTMHARERAEVGERPTANAFPEARSAPDAAIFIDQKTGTFVLLGKNSRVHFFNKTARHVTSVRFPGEEIKTRIDKNRWRAAAAPEIRAFREQLNQQLERGGGNGLA